MSDNVTAPATGAIFATKDIGSVQFPRNLLVTPDGADISPATQGGQDAIVAAIGALSLLVDGDEGLLGQILAKLIAAPATSAKQDTAIVALQNSAPADDVFAITPNDTVPLAVVPKALLVTVAGVVAVRGTGTTAVPIPVSASQILPIRARYVYATGTTATVVGLV